RELIFRRTYAAAVSCGASPALRPSTKLALFDALFEPRFLSRVATCQAAGGEGPAEMVTMTLENHAALTVRACGIEAGNGCLMIVEDLKTRVHPEAAFGEDDPRL